MANELIEANWRVELNCDCPKCLEYVNLLDYADFWDSNNNLIIGETGTKYSENIEVKCPECGEEFRVNLTY